MNKLQKKISLILLYINFLIFITEKCVIKLRNKFA